MIFEKRTRPIPITEEMVQLAYKKVRSNQGSAGVDSVNFQYFEMNLSKNLYKIWNRMSSGSYFPAAVKEQLIDKGGGKKRKLGIPTIGDRIAQQVVKGYIEPRMESIFHASSYGYRPMRSAHQALTEVRKNVRQYSWVIDLDIKAFFDNVNHEKLMLALEKHVDEKWVKMYVKRWLEAPIAQADGCLHKKDGKGTPQGGVISPLLANLYLHYSFDKWMSIYNPSVPFVRYADDMVIHCQSEQQAEYLLGKIKARLSECDLEVHPKKSKIVYCKDYRRPLKGKPVKFDFLGFSFRPESKASKRGGMFLGFDCSISKKSYSKIVKELRDMRFQRWMSTWEELANLLNPKIRGWMQYYDTFRPWTLKTVFHRLHNRISKWILNHFKRFKGSRQRAFNHLKFMRRRFPTLFYHWEMGYPSV
jgi:RNA-directed DNA polymerase